MIHIIGPLWGESIGHKWLVMRTALSRYGGSWEQCFVTGGVKGSQHYSDVIMGAMASQITCVSIVCSSGGDQRKHQSIASLAFVRGIHRWLVVSPHKGPVTRKMFPFDDVIMKSMDITRCHRWWYDDDMTKPKLLNTTISNFQAHISRIDILRIPWYYPQVNPQNTCGDKSAFSGSNNGL